MLPLSGPSSTPTGSFRGLPSKPDPFLDFAESREFTRGREAFRVLFGCPKGTWVILLRPQAAARRGAAIALIGQRKGEEQHPEANSDDLRTREGPGWPLARF